MCILTPHHTSALIPLATYTVCSCVISSQDSFIIRLFTPLIHQVFHYHPPTLSPSVLLPCTISAWVFGAGGGIVSTLVRLSSSNISMGLWGWGRYSVHTGAPILLQYFHGSLGLEGGIVSTLVHLSSSNIFMGLWGWREV
ncbi:uncharacterized protein F5147DRAFT_655011 [Suillus discolor]|uniref:Uncharacterized protein n=1 Tax=Suillus discolor TaxID=1912936 RepID=A0A9P7JRM8_9AGAM|nr:uncharacterized protein F5147DRAFT_655011 [Suillus discolor]KAG2102554.1 hypothetical protein F5147DRAFT_655011 [Suillus discolor]